MPHCFCAAGDAVSRKCVWVIPKASSSCLWCKRRAAVWLISTSAHQSNYTALNKRPLIKAANFRTNINNIQCHNKHFTVLFFFKENVNILHTSWYKYQHFYRKITSTPEFVRERSTERDAQYFTTHVPPLEMINILLALIVLYFRWKRSENVFFRLYLRFNYFSLARRYYYEKKWNWLIAWF